MRSVEPAVLVAEVEHHGRCFSIALVRTHYATEGTAIVEELQEGSHWIDFGNWWIKRDDEGPATLSTEYNLPDDVTIPGPLADKLSAELARIGASWGIEAWEECS